MAYSKWKRYLKIEKTLILRQTGKNRFIRSAPHSLPVPITRMLLQNAKWEEFMIAAFTKSGAGNVRTRVRAVR